MNWWNVLEISRDSDLKTIKKAYAKLLKIYSPEDDAEGYQRLREAYDTAIKYAKRNNKNQEFSNDNLNKVIINEVNANIQNKFELNLDINEIYDKAQDTSLNLNEQINQFLNRLNEIYNDICLRTDLSAWEDLLNSDVVWNVDAFPIIEDELFNFLSNHKYLPAEIWTKLNNNFTWSENEIKLYDQYYAPLVDEFLGNLKEPSRLKYDFIKSINPEIADEYLYERQQVDEALKYKKYARAYKHLKNANSLFSQDAELLRLMGNYNYELNDMEKALEFYKSAFEINNNDLESALYIGMILASNERFGEAISYLKVYLSYYNNDKLALNYIAYCYYYNDDLIMAKENFRRLLSSDENNKVIKKYLKNIEAQLEGKHVRKIRFDKDNLIVKEIIEKEINTEKKSDMKGKIYEIKSFIIKYLIKVAILYVLFYVIKHPLGFLDSVSFNNKQNNKTYEDIDITKQILDSKNNVYMVTHLSNVKPIKYYKLSEQFENRSIFSEREIDEKGLRNKVESQLYIGTSKEILHIFADSKFSDKTIDENGVYEIEGTMCYFDTEIWNRIREEYAADYQGLDWVDNGFI